MKLSNIRPAALATCVMALVVPFASAQAASAQALAAAPPAIHGLNPADFDRSVSACVSLNAFGNGGWLKANPLPADQSYWGSFSILFEENRDKLHTVLEKAAANKSAAAGSDERKIGDFWASCMDEAAIEAAGAGPLKPELERIARISTSAELQAEITRLQLIGANAVFDFGSEQDRKTSTEVIAGASQGGLGLPEGEYYTKTDEESKTLREQYVAHIARMLQLLGDDPAKAAADAKAIMALETRLAEASMTPVERRDPEKTYNRMDAAKLSALTPRLVLDGLLPGGRPQAHGGQRRAAEVLRGGQQGNAGDAALGLEGLSALEAPERCRAPPLEGVRRRRFRLLRKGPPGHAGERGPLEALRRSRPTARSARPSASRTSGTTSRPRPRRPPTGWSRTSSPRCATI